MSFQIEDVGEVASVNQALISLPPFLSLYSAIGDYKMSASTGDTEYWLLCDGRSLLRSEYPLLFNVIGTSFGSDDADHFTLPDFRGRIPGIIGAGSGLTTRTIGTSTGTETVTLTTNQIPSHSHTITDPGHTHTYLGVNSQNAASGGDNVAENSPRPTETTSSSTTGISINNTGGGQAHENMQPTLFCGNIFILYNLINY